MTKLIVYAIVGVIVFGTVFEMGNRYGTNAWRLAEYLETEKRIVRNVEEVERDAERLARNEPERIESANRVYETANQDQCITSEKQAEKYANFIKELYK